MTTKVRHISGDWSLIDKKARDTLVPCPVCKETGMTVVQSGLCYATQACRWCTGIGGVPKRVYMAHQRWLRILAANKRLGRCG